ncbi:MAG: helix-hairpin-helix domain-containing protein [archaeon]
MKNFILILLLIIFVPTISAVCEDNQIDINSASLEKLDGLDGIGPVYAGRIVEGRPFESLEDLIEVSGIGEITLQKIKDQGLACVEGETSEESDAEEEEIIEEEETAEDPSIIDYQIDNTEDSDENNEIVLDKKVETISLNSKVVEENNLVYISKDAKVVDYLAYGFAIFLIFIIGVLVWERF